MLTAQSFLAYPKSLFFFGTVVFCVLILSAGHLDDTTKAISWIKAVSLSNGRDSSPVQQRLAEVFNSTLGFEKVFAISLPERTDHKDALTLTSALTGFHIDFVDGVKPGDVLEKTLPPHTGIANSGARGAWRGHINAIQEIVAKGYGSALIAEDDFDWDIRLKEQLRDFAVASTGFLSQFPPDHVPHFASAPGIVLGYSDLATWLSTNEDKINVPFSPYGDGWDVLWLGNCGMRPKARREDWQTLTIANLQDPTVAPVENYHHWDWAEEHPYNGCPNHTRLYLSQPTDGTCTIAYAVSQKGARKILLELGMERADKAFDLMLQDFCQGGWFGGLAEPHACWGVVPPLFAQHRPAGLESKDSDISNADDGRVRDVGYTKNIQRSVRLNVRKLLSDPPIEIVDQFPYTEGT